MPGTYDLEKMPGTYDLEKKPLLVVRAGLGDVGYLEIGLIVLNI